MPRGCPDTVLITAGFRVTVAEVYGAPTSTPRTANGFRSYNCLPGRVRGTMARWSNSGYTSCMFFVAGTPATARWPTTSQYDCSSAPSNGRDKRVLDVCRSTTGLSTRLRLIVANVFRLQRQD